MRQKVVKSNETEYSIVDDVLRFYDGVCVPIDDDLRHKILTEAYSSLYTVYLRSVKMY